MPLLSPGPTSIQQNGPKKGWGEESIPPTMFDEKPNPDSYWPSEQSSCRAPTYLTDICQKNRESSVILSTLKLPLMGESLLSETLGSSPSNIFFWGSVLAFYVFFYSFLFLWKPLAFMGLLLCDFTSFDRLEIAF